MISETQGEGGGGSEPVNFPFSELESILIRKKIPFTPLKSDLNPQFI